MTFLPFSLFCTINYPEFIFSFSCFRPKLGEKINYLKYLFIL